MVRQIATSLISGVVATSIALLSGLVLLFFLGSRLDALARRAPPPDMSLLLGDTPNLQNWDCGCPPLQQRPTMQTVLKRFPLGYPTRCLKDNHSSNYKPKNWPLSDPWPKAAQGMEYPDMEYPKNFPSSGAAASEKEFWRPPGYPTIPFPGWPKGRKAVSKWDEDGQLRKGYKRSYQKKSADQKPPPWIVKSGPPWEFYEIHHIMERQFGGEDRYANLVPMMSLPNSWTDKLSHEHGQFTKWWEHITVDDDIKELVEKVFKGARAEKHKGLQGLRDVYRSIQSECP